MRAGADVHGGAREHKEAPAGPDDAPTSGAEGPAQRLTVETALEAERRFEASSVQIPTLPQAPQFRAWKLALRGEVATTFGSTGVAQLATNF